MDRLRLGDVRPEGRDEVTDDEKNNIAADYIDDVVRDADGEIDESRLQETTLAILNALCDYVEPVPLIAALSFVLTVRETVEQFIAPDDGPGTNAPGGES